MNNVLSGLDLPTGPGLSNQLGISGVPTLSAKQIYNDKWDEEEDIAVGPGEGQDWEDEVDRELAEEEDEPIGQVKMEVQTPLQMGQRQKRKRIVRRVVERPKSVYERFPSFEKDKILDFTELFKGVTVQKSRVVRRPFTGAFDCQVVPGLSSLPYPNPSRVCVPEEEGCTEELSPSYSRRCGTSSREQACRTGSGVGRCGT